MKRVSKKASTLATACCCGAVMLFGMRHLHAKDLICELFERSFEESSPLSQGQAFRDRYKNSKLLKLLNQKEDFKGATVQIRLPKGYDPNGQHPMMVHLKYTKNAEAMFPVFDKYGIVWCYVRNTSTDRKSNDWQQRCIQYALNAAHNMVNTYAIDPQRVYISGVSGGSASAGMTAPFFPDVFFGAFYFSSSSAYTFKHPEEFEDQLKNERRFVFTTGEKDGSQEEVVAAYNEYKSNGFKNLLLIDEKTMGHGEPPPPFFEQAWLFIDGNR